MSIGNHEFDWGVERLGENIRESRYKYIGSNVMNKTSKRVIFSDEKNVVDELILWMGDIRVGVIGLTTVLTPSTSSGDVSGLEFLEYISVVNGHAASLKSRGVDIVIVTAHIGMVCTSPTLLSLSLYSSSTPQTYRCNEQDELALFLAQLEPGTVDAILAGHTHTVLHQFLNTIPVLISSSYARYLSVLHFQFHLPTRKILKPSTQIEGPIPVCDRVFTNNRICDVDLDQNTEQING